MYDFSLTEEQELIQKVARDFAENELRPKLRERERTRRLEPECHRAYREAGFSMIEVPEALGGAGLGPIERVLVTEALAQGDAAAALALDRIGPALYPLLEMGEERHVAEALDAQRRGWVIVDDEARCFRIEEARIFGSWPWIPLDVLEMLVVVQNDRALVITEGFALSSIRACALEASGASELAVDAPVTIELAATPKALARTRARLRLYAAVHLVGVGAASLEYARRYTLERIAFGRPVAHHQSVAFLIAELSTRLDAARLSALRGAWTLGLDGDPTEACAAALLDAADVALEAAEQGVQLLGGHGYVTDHPVEKWMREARTLAMLFGGRDAALDALAQASAASPALVGFSPPAFAEGSAA